SCLCFASGRRHTSAKRDWSSDVCSSDLASEETSCRIVLLPAHEVPGAYLSFGSSARKSAPLILSMGDSASGLLSFAPLASPAAKKHRIYRRAPHDLCRKIFH